MELPISIMARVEDGILNVFIPPSSSFSFEAADKALKIDIINLVESYNNTKDVEHRKEIIQLLEEYSGENKVLLVEVSEHFKLDQKTGLAYLKDTSTPVPKALFEKCQQFMDEGLSIEPLVNFWKHLLLNPDPHVANQLFSFLQHNGHPITSKGYFIAYKSCKLKYKYDKATGDLSGIAGKNNSIVIQEEYDEDTGEKLETIPTQEMLFTPFHSGPHGMIIEVGKPISMPREECDSDPNRTCSAGLHVGSMEYVKDFCAGNDQVILEVLVSPRNVVSVPVDYNNTKMRTCEYYPVGIVNGENSEIFIENDYTAYDLDSLTVDLENRNAALEAEIVKIESRITELKRLRLASIEALK